MLVLYQASGKEIFLLFSRCVVPLSFWPLVTTAEGHKSEELSSGPSTMQHV